MAVYPIIPQSFTWDDLCDTIRYYGGTVDNGNGMTAFLWTTKINKWSRNKPVRHAKVVGLLTDAEMKSVNYGLEVPVGNADPDTAIKGAYKYILPGGGDSSPFRIDDFIGYSPEAIAPIIGVGDFEVNTITDITAEFTYMYGFGGDIGLVLQDFQELSDKYLACVMTYYIGSSVILYTTFKTSDKPISEGASSIFSFNTKTEKPFNVPDVHDVTYYFLASKNKVVPGELLPPQMFYALPFPEDKPGYGKVTIKQSSGFEMELTQISQEPDIFIGSLISMYVGVDRPDSPARYYKVNNPGDFYVSGKVTNTGNTTVFLYGYNFTIWASNTFGVQSGSADTGYLTPDIWLKDASKTWYKVTNYIELKPNSIIDVRFGLPRFLTYVDRLSGTFYKYQKKSIYIEVMYNDRFAGSTMMFNVES